MNTNRICIYDSSAWVAPAWTRNGYTEYSREKWLSNEARCLSGPKSETEVIAPIFPADSSVDIQCHKWRSKTLGRRLSQVHLTCSSISFFCCEPIQRMNSHMIHCSSQHRIALKSIYYDMGALKPVAVYFAKQASAFMISGHFKSIQINIVRMQLVKSIYNEAFQARARMLILRIWPRHGGRIPPDVSPLMAHRRAAITGTEITYRYGIRRGWKMTCFQPQPTRIIHDTLPASFRNSQTREAQRKINAL